MKNRIKLAVFILFYEKLNQTIECISSFLKAGVNIYIFNNASSISSRHSLGKFCEKYGQIRIYDSPVNLGTGGGRNYLITHTTEEWFLSVDNDIVMRTDGWVEKFMRHVSSNPGTEVFIPKLFVVKNNCYTISYPYRIERRISFPDQTIINEMTNTFPGGASFINRGLYDRLGLYDDKLFALEDYELCLRGLISGNQVKAKLIGDIELAHDHRPARKMLDKKAVMLRYDLSNVEKSYKMIADKHGIILKDSGKIGSIHNLEAMLNSYNPFSTYFWKRLIPKPMKRSFRDLETRFRRKSLPTFCNLFMTDRCNFKCPSCRRSIIGINRSNDITLPTIQRLLSLYPSINRFCIAGLGEPTLCSHFVEIVDFLKRNKKSVGIITNGTNIAAFQALDFEPDYISISLYGYDNDSYLNYTGKKIFDRIVENFKKMRDIFQDVGFSYIVNKKNYIDLARLLLLCDTLRPQFLDLHNYLAYDPNNREEVSRVITAKDKEIINYINAECDGRPYRINKPAIADFDRPQFKCTSYNFLINLDGDGNIGGCQRQIPPQRTYGNIFTDDDPYNSAEMLALRSKMRKRSYVHSECIFCFGNFCDES